MKIKAVCTLTGLTDRTVRYYIEEGLISPAFTENYLGRKAFDFSQNDVEQLTDISVLRKFDFTIEEIKAIACDAEESKAIIAHVKLRTAQAAAEGQMRQHTLSQIEDGKAYSVTELAKELANASDALPEAQERVKKSFWKILWAVVKTVFTLLLVWLPVVFQVFFFLVTINLYAYPKFHFGSILFMVLSVLPTAAILLLGKTKTVWKKVAKAVMLVLCAVSLFINFTFAAIFPAGTLAISETTNIVHYRDVDANCLANRDGFFNELFPVSPHYFENVKGADGHYETVYLDAHYYYRYLSFMDYTYDIYAQWPLEKAEFDKEVARVQELFNSTNYVTVQKGSYTCLISYSGDPPFRQATDSYTYYIFAYDAQSLTVRYILCDSLENGADQPYYLSLDW